MSDARDAIDVSAAALTRAFAEPTNAIFEARERSYR